MLMTPGKQAPNGWGDNPFSTEAMALQARPPAWMARMVSLTLCLVALLAVAYASWAKMDVVVSSQGRIIPSGRSKVVQPLEAGVVRAIHVRDGQAVKAGDVLVELDPTSAEADRERLQRELWEAETDVQRVDATLAGQARLDKHAGVPDDIAANQRAMLASRLQEQRARVATLDADVRRREAERETVLASIRQLQPSLALVEKKHGLREALVRDGHMAPNSLIETEMEVLSQRRELAALHNRLNEAQAGIGAARLQLAQAGAEFRARGQSELLEATRKRDAAQQELVKVTQRRDYQVLRSPIDGVVQQLAVFTIGGVVTQAQPLLTVVPESAAFEVEAQVMNRDIGHVTVGQRVINKVETFDFTRYGYLEGEVLWVGTDAVMDQRMGPVYPVRIKLTERRTPYAVNGRHGEVNAGMNVTADIRTGQRRMISYFMAPLLRHKEEALRER